MSGNQGLGQDVGDGVTALLTFGNPGKGLSRVKALSTVARETETLRGLDLARTTAKVGQKTAPVVEVTQTLRKDQPWTIRMGQEWKAKVYGKAHGKTGGH